MGAAGPDCHCARAWTMSFTSMVPITIFSLLTVSWAAAPSRRSRVMSTRLPLVIVLAANLLASKHGTSGQTVPPSPSHPLGCSGGDQGSVCHPWPPSHVGSRRFLVLTEALSVPTVICVGLER